MVSIYKLITGSIVLHAVSLMLPFVMPSEAGARGGTIGHSLPVYAAFAAVLVYQLVIELAVLISLKSVFNTDEENLSGANLDDAIAVKRDEERLEEARERAPSCNRFIVMRMMQGMIISISTFTHVCFAAAVIKATAAGAYQKPDHSAIYVVFMVFVAVASATAVVTGNRQRCHNIRRHLAAEPRVHRLLPHAFRNAQLCWALNFDSAAILLDSISMSEYMLDLGEPVTAKKSRKDDDDEVELPSVKPINVDMLTEKMKYQDLPMSCAITAQIITALVVAEGAEVMESIVFLVITLLSMLVSYLICI